MIPLVLGGVPAAPPALVAKVDQIMRDYAAADAPGASVLVLRDGKIVLRKSYGLANVEEGVAATPSTHYRLASVTKQFTAAAILLLAERKQLTFDDRVRQHLPALPQDGVTIRHLLTHTSGIIDYEDVIPDGASEQLKDADVLRLLESQRSTYFEPGTAYRYSNSGYALLALIVEKVSGQSFAAFLREHLVRPIGMKTAVAHEEGVSVVPDRAYGYSRDGDAWRRTDQSLTSAVLGDGGIYASVDDLAKWLLALDRGRFAEAFVPRVDTGKAGVHYGYGWRIGDGVISHTGETRGFRNAVVRFPKERIAVVVLTNRNEGEPIDLALAIARLSGAPALH